MICRLSHIALLLLAIILLSGFTSYEQYIDEQNTIVAQAIVSNEELKEETELYFPKDVSEIMYTLDLYKPSGVTVEQLEAGLLGDLKQHAATYVAMEEKYGINAIFLASKDGFESGWGKYAYGNNLSGWAYMSFNSEEECIEHVTFYLNLWYFSEPHDKSECGEECQELIDQYGRCTVGQYYNGTTMSGINVCYNGRQIWLERLGAIMMQVYDRIEDSGI